MFNVYEVRVYHYEGWPVSLGYFANYRDAEFKLEEEWEEWEGDNVIDIHIVKHEVR